MSEKIKIVEKEDVTRDYDMRGINAIIDHPKHGRLLICDGFGGIDNLEGGAVRWKHGMVVQLQDDDTLDGLQTAEWNDYTNLWGAVVNGYDKDRPVLGWDGSAVASLATKLNLKWQPSRGKPAQKKIWKITKYLI